MYVNFASVPIRCPVCDKKINKIDRAHAAEHGYKTLRQFKKEHGIDYETLAKWYI